MYCLPVVHLSAQHLTTCVIVEASSTSVKELVVPRRRQVPDKTTFERWINEGQSQEWMVAEIERTTHEKVSRSAVAQAICRYGLSNERLRFTEQVPWRVNAAHLSQYPVRMLRLLGRRQNALPLTEKELDRLNAWLMKLASTNSVVGYDPTSIHGFAYIPRGEDDGFDIPIRTALVKLPE